MSSSLLAVSQLVYFTKHDPALIERRSRAGPSNEQRPEQKIIMTLLLATSLLMLIVPGLDHRFYWSTVPGWLSVVGDAGIVASFAGFFIVMKQNSHAAATVYVEAAQPVISTGPLAALGLPKGASRRRSRASTSTNRALRGSSSSRDAAVDIAFLRIFVNF